VICTQCDTERPVNKDGRIRRHGCPDLPDAPTSDLVELPWPRPNVTKNQLRRMHYQAEAKARANAINEARWAIRAARPKPLQYADVILHWRVPNRVRRDGDGAQWQLSVALDALVREGVLADDDWIHVRHSGVTTHEPQPGLPGAMWLEIVPAVEIEEKAS
jgi:hypothetical protein